jgi:hypothetical protein
MSGYNDRQVFIHLFILDWICSVFLLFFDCRRRESFIGVYRLISSKCEHLR